ncbi:mechanosensitive ion channel family protein, partial [bacterium]
SLNGDVHTIPNGQISLTTNQTKLWSRTIVDINVAHEENVEDIMAVLDAVARAMQQDEVWGRKILDSVVMGVQGLGENAVVIRVLLKTRAGEQWGAAREYHKRVKLKFDELGIEIPRPQRVVSHRATDEKASASAMRKKRAAVLRFVRASRGEALPDELELAAMSVEERDRAATLAKLTTDKPAGSGPDAKAQAAGPPDAERLAERMAQDAAAVPRPESPPPAPDVQPKAAPGEGPRPAS